MLYDIKERIITDLETKLDANSYSIDFLLGTNIMSKNGSLTLETVEGLDIVVSDFIPGMPFLFDGQLIPVDVGLIVNYGIALEFYVVESLLDNAMKALTEIVHTTLDKDSYLIASSPDTYIEYMAAEPQIMRTEIFNYRKTAVVRLNIVATLTQGIKRGTGTKLKIREYGSANQPQVLPFLTASINVGTEPYSDQIIGTEETVSINTNKSWAAGISLYATDDVENEALYAMLKSGSEMNKVFELTIERESTDVETLNVIVTSIDEILDSREIKKYTVGFLIAAGALYN